MKKLLFLSISCLLIKVSGFADDSATKSKLQTLIQEHKLEEAKALADKEIQSHPGDTDLIRRRGFVHFMQGNYKSATADFSSYLAEKPGSAKGYLYRGLAYIAMGDDSKGKEDVNRALSIDSSLITVIDELRPKIASVKPKSKYVPMMTKKGASIKTKKGGDVVYKAKT